MRRTPSQQSISPFAWLTPQPEEEENNTQKRFITQKEDQMIKNRNYWLLIAVLTIAAFTLFACAPAATEAPTEAPPEVAPTEAEAPPPEVEPTAPPPPEVEPTEPEEAPPPAEETTIVITMPQDPAGFNGLITDTGYEQLVGELVMLGLTEADPMGNIFPELAVDIPTLENGGVEFDEDTWTMDVTWQIRDDVFWADGEQVTVDDIIFTWDAITDEETGIWADGVDYTESLEKVDDFTFIVHFYEGSVYPNYRLQFGGENFFIYPEHYCDPEQGFLTWDCNMEPLSNGPYILTEWETNDHMTFEKNPNYFEAGKPSIDKVIVQIVPEHSVRKSLMLEGDADVHYWPPDAIFEEYKASDNVNALTAPTERWVMRLFPNLAAYGSIDPVADPHPFLSEVEVRRAIRMAIDVDTIVNDIHLGHGRPVWTEMFRPPYDVCDIPRPAYDPEAAKALLDDAGWTDTDGDGIRECRGCAHAAEGDVMTMEFSIYAEYGEELELAQQYIAENLKAIGIGTSLSMVEGTVLWAPYEEGGTEQNGNFDLNMWDDGYPGTDPTDNDLYYYYQTASAEPDYGWNVGRWSNEEFDTLLDEAYTLDEDYRKEVFCELANILEAELPQILLYSTMEAHGVSKRIQGAEPNVNDPLTWNIADWTVTD